MPFVTQPNEDEWAKHEISIHLSPFYGERHTFF